MKMAQNGRKCPEMSVSAIDEDGAEALLVAVVRQASRDLRRRNVKEKDRRTAQELLQFLGVSDEAIAEVSGMDVVDEAQPVAEDWQALQDRLDELDRRAEVLARTGKPEARPAQAAPPALPPSPFEGMTAERLDALGVSRQWANMTAQQLDELSRRQAHRDRAAALGVLPEYLPEEVGND